jgi:hypothetical protein
MEKVKYRITLEIGNTPGSDLTHDGPSGTVNTVSRAQSDGPPIPSVEVVGVEFAEGKSGGHSGERARFLLDETLSQIRDIAHDGGLLGEQAEAGSATRESAADTLRALTAKLQRICNIAEASEPDEDWRPFDDVAGTHLQDERRPE